MDELDIFADLERTLCEGLENLNFTRNCGLLKSNESSEQSLIDCLENVKDLGRIHGPAVRGYNLYKATKAFKEKRYLDSVYCETFALSLSMMIKFHANKIMEAEHHMPTEDNIANFLQEKQQAQPQIIEYIDRFLKDMLADERPTSVLKSIEFENGTELINLCYQFPKEWTVIQLCKQVNLEHFSQTRDEALRHPCPIFLTLFCYPMSERFNQQPIKIVLNQKDLKELYETCHNFSKKLNDANAHSYFRQLKKEQFEMEIVDKLRKLLGPWIVLFSGKTKNESDKNLDNEIFARVDQFLSNSCHNYSRIQNILICLIARRLYMLTKENIKDGALYISTTKEEWFELMDFFHELKSDCETVTECYPVILVIDEQIDHFYWEMCNPEQEFTRVDSIVTLLKLYYLHQNNISSGYFNIKQRRGSAVLNPDCTLQNFNTLVHPFIKEFSAPSWNVLVEQKPMFPELRAMLADSDIYVYCGHGSGLQFISSYETCQVVTNAVVFLLGCSSVAFQSKSGYSIGSAAHQYYHISKCPAVIGYLNTTFVNWASIFLNVTLAKWLSLTNNSIDLNLFGTTDEETKFARKLQVCLGATNGSPYLTKVISEYRRTEGIPVAFRAILCYRGLPVYLK